jgi:hypothetical protein
MGQARTVGKAMSRFKPTAPGTAQDLRIASVEESPRACHSVDDYVREISRLWGDAQRRLLLIGRYLVQAKAALEHGEYEDLVRDKLPFTPRTAHRLRTVAEAIDIGTLPADRAPRDYTAAYVLARLDPEERQQAEAQGLVRADVSRREVEAFKRQIRANTTVKADALPSTDEAIRRLEARLAELDAEREVVISRLAELRGTTK